MTLLVADQDADIKAKQEYIAKLEQDIKVRIAEIEAINNVRDYFNTPEFRQRVSDKKKKRKLEEFEDEQEEKIEEQRNTIASIVSTDNRNDKMKQEESELLAKLKDVNLSNSQYSKELEAINERAQAAAANEANPFATFTNLQQDIKDAEKKQRQEELKQQKEAEKLAEEQAQAEAPAEEQSAEGAEPADKSQPATEETAPAEENKEETPAEEPKKKTSLSSLLSSAKKLKK